MSPLLATLLFTFAVLTAAFVALWLVSVWLRDASIVDPFWGASFALAAGTALAAHPTSAPRTWLIVGMTAVWGLRLSVHLLMRNFGHGEDRRYAAMRVHHGPRFWWVSLFTVFLLQAAIAWVVSLPVQAAIVIAAPTPFGALDFMGVALWFIGLLFETVGDWQLARFRADPQNAGRVMDRGLWRYTRHPNYFGDACIWWGLYFVAAAGGAAWTLFSPALMTGLLLKVSGVSLLESTIGDRRPDYADYRRRTSAFLPWPPKA
jgi:steroid 5-alpha reductase family enzyme